MKRAAVFMLACVFSLSLLAGCGANTEKANEPELSEKADSIIPDKTDSSSQNESPIPSVTEDSCAEPSPSVEDETKDINTEAEEAFMAFLRGEQKIKTSDAYLQPDEFGYSDGIPEGEYDYNELKAAVFELIFCDFYVSYSLVDLGNDSKIDMVIRCDSYSGAFSNWVGTLCYEDGQLYLSSDWYDGYRSFSELYTSEYLLSGGSGGAGLYVSDLFMFNERAEINTVYESSLYFSSFAVQLFWKLQHAGLITENQREEYYAMFDDLYRSSMCITECRKDGIFYFSAADRAEDEQEVYDLEQKLIDLLSECGCELVSEEKMTELLSFAPYDDELVMFTQWEYDEALAAQNAAG